MQRIILDSWYIKHCSVYWVRCMKKNMPHTLQDCQWLNKEIQNQTTVVLETMPESGQEFYYSVSFSTVTMTYPCYPFFLLHSSICVTLMRNVKLVMKEVLLRFLHRNHTNVLISSFAIVTIFTLSDHRSQPLSSLHACPHTFNCFKPLREGLHAGNILRSPDDAGYTLRVQGWKSTAWSQSLPYHTC